MSHSHRMTHVVVATVLALLFVGCPPPEVGEPAPPVFTIGPVDPMTEDDLVLDVTNGGDLNRDYVYAWYQDDMLRQNQTGPRVPASATRRNQRWKVFIRDKGATGAWQYQAETYVLNTPARADVVLSPDDVYTDTDLDAVLRVTDPDKGDVAVQVEWFVDDDLVGGSSMVAIARNPVPLRADLSSGLYVKHQRVRLEVQLNDGQEDSELIVIDVPVLNKPPTAPDVLVTPRLAFPGNGLFCERMSASYDADGDPVTYTTSWAIGTDAYNGVTATTVVPDDTIPDGIPLHRQQWNCLVTPHDGEEDGDVGVGTVRIVDHGDPVEFGTCGAEGPFGPSQADCDEAYYHTLLRGLVTVSGGLQYYRVPKTGDYVIEAWGAQGAAGEPSVVGGRGAWVKGVFPLVEGEVLSVVVGQMGSGQSAESNGGGGGGSFVVDATGNPLLVAGGGGGTRLQAGHDGCDAWTGQFGGLGSGAWITTWDCPVKEEGQGEGGIATAVSWGSAGGGFYSDGESEVAMAAPEGGGRAWVNGAVGGLGNDACAHPGDGGFGGGGSGRGCYGGGGGGGYSGGDGGLIAGGGGSFNAGSARESKRGEGVGDGLVIIGLVD